MSDIEQITRIDLDLSNKMSAFDVKLDTIITTQDGVNEHLRKLNGKVADQERRLSDFEGFKKSVEESAKSKAQKSATYRSTLISIVIPIVTIILLYLVQRVFHIQLPQI